MERYSGIRATEEVPEDSEAEWAAPGGETGLEEPMRQFGIGGGQESYPERPHRSDCIYYLRTGFCGFGSRCRYNHPRDRSLGMGTLRRGVNELPERIGQPVCQYYMRTGMCKFGFSCKYHHPKHGVGSSAPPALNYYGYPLRTGEKECSYYVKTGQCNFGVTCKFHHPQPAGIHVQEQTPGHRDLATPPALHIPTVYQTMQSPVQSSQQYGPISSNWPVPRPPMPSVPGSHISGSYNTHFLLPPGVVSVPGWTPYPGHVSPVTFLNSQPAGGGSMMYVPTQLSPQATYPGPCISTTSADPSGIGEKEHAFPERPGQPDCLYYLRTGDCKFGPTCKYHHPPEWSPQIANFVLGPIGLPLRPGAPLCSHFAQNGVCKFGPTCKFDHSIRPMSYSPSASSLTDMPVSPYPVGSTNPTLAPLSSSSDLRPELFSSVDKDTFSLRMSSMNISCASVGSTFSKSEHVSKSSTQQPTQGSTASSGGSRTSHGSEASSSR